MRMKRVLLASSALALFAGAQSAQAAGDMYVSVFGGPNWASDSSASFVEFDGSSTSTFMSWGLDADTGFVLGAAVGTKIDGWIENARVELEAAYRRNDLHGGWAATRIFDFGTPTTTSATGAIDANLSTFSILANFWYECDMGWKVRPYIGGGVGWARTHLEGAVLDDDGSGFPDDVFDTSNSGFAWQLGVGFNYRAMPGVDVGIGYRYFVGPEFTEPFEVDPDFEWGEDFGKVENENHSVTVNLTVEIY